MDLNATSGALLTLAMTVALGLVKLLEMFAKPLIEERQAKRRDRNGDGPHCRLTEMDRAQLFTVQANTLQEINRSSREQTEILRRTHIEHGAKLDRLVDMHDVLLERKS